MIHGIDKCFAVKNVNIKMMSILSKISVKNIYKVTVSFFIGMTESTLPF